MADNLHVSVDWVQVERAVSVDLDVWADWVRKEEGEDEEGAVD